MKKLTAEWCRNHIESMRANGLSLLEEYYVQALEIALPALEEQERSEWSGGGCPAPAGTLVDIRDRDGTVWGAVKAQPHDEYSYADAIFWKDVVQLRNKIIAYRVIENDGREG